MLLMFLFYANRPLVVKMRLMISGNFTVVHAMSTDCTARVRGLCNGTLQMVYWLRHWIKNPKVWACSPTHI